MDPSMTWSCSAATGSARTQTRYECRYGGVNVLMERLALLYLWPEYVHRRAIQQSAILGILLPLWANLCKWWNITYMHVSQRQI